MRERQIVGMSVTKALWRQLKRHCKTERVHMRDVIEYAIAVYLQEHKNANHPQTH